ncbi:major tail protein [Rhizobium phage RHph_N3_8]|uniref:major tail protein n=1 Tax=Rhizobium phage RHph_N3_8 TaxID=2509748 RepID=UPI001AF0F6FE|nr:major tail protein [Rhizobium phage RHph_N3_8]QIG76013.1 major tail protein [Rhizobium phage RHph_N3_8]
MNQIHELPPESDFGWEFNYAAWAPNTQVTLCRVPWNASYKDIVRFPGGRTALNAYIDGKPSTERLTLTDAVYLRMNEPIDLDIPFSVANELNYLRVYNPAQPIFSPGGNDKPSYFYYFITHVEYIAPNATRFHVQLDVWQTYAYEFHFGQCFIERSHIGIAADNAFDEYGRQFLNIPEGIDIGGEYNTAFYYTHNIAKARGEQSYGILVMSTAVLTGDLGTAANPTMKTATGSVMENLPSGCNIYWVDADHFLTFMQQLSNKPWISSNIISITAIPNDAIERYEMIASDVAIDWMPSGSVKEFIVGSIKNPTMSFEANWREERALPLLPAEYRHLKKFLTFPYMALEMTTYSGQPIILKPEAWDNADADFVELPHLVPGNAKIVFYPVGYNRRTGAAEDKDGMGFNNDGGEFLDVATSISNFPQFSIVNNSYLAFMASNRNSIAFQHDSADWSQTRALTGNQLSFDQAQAGMSLTGQLTELQIGAATQSTNLSNQTSMFQNVQGAGNAVLGAIMNKNPINGAAGVLNAGVNQAITQNHNNQSLNISTNLANAANNANVANAGYMADTNLQYANYSAKGDYQNAIAGITARVQDAKLLAPTTSGQVGGDTFNLAKYQWGVDLKIKMLQGAAMRQVAGYWMRFGYQMNIWGTLPDDLHCMSHFTYWKLRELYVTDSRAPEAFKETIRGIFEKGVTVWKNPNDIGNVPMTNNLPMAGFTL